MTHIIGMKLENVVYIYSDSAVTSSIRLGPKDTTSFGKEDIYNSGKYTQERMLKLFTFRNVVVGLAGDIEYATNFIQMFKDELERSNKVDASLNVAINSHTPIHRDDSYELIIGARDSGGVRLLHFNKNNNQQVSDCPLAFGQADAGSIEEPDRTSVLGGIGKLTKEFGSRPYECLIRSLAFLQCYGHHNDLLKDGVGGIFSGMAIDSKRIYRQPRTLYAVMSEPGNLEKGNVRPAEVVMCGFFAKALVVLSNMRKNNLVLYNSITIDGKSLRKRGPEKLSNVAFRAREFDFVVLFNKEKQIVLIVETRRKSETYVIRLTRNAKMGIGDSSIRMSLKLTEQIMELLSGKRKMGDFPEGEMVVYFFVYNPKKNKWPKG